MSGHAAPDAPVTGATREQGISREQVNTALVGLMDEWNSPRNINPRTQRRYKQPWSSQLWFRFMRAGLEALVPPGMVIAPAGDVISADDRAAIGRLVLVLDLFSQRMDKYPEFTGVHRELFGNDVDTIRHLAAGGQS